MVVFGIVAGREAAGYFRLVRENYKDNVLSFGFSLVVKSKRGGWLLRAEPNFPPFWQFGFLLLVAAVIFGSWGSFFSVVLVVLSALFLVFGLFWTPLPYYWAARVALRRRGVRARFAGRRECERRGWL